MNIYNLDLADDITYGCGIETSQRRNHNYMITMCREPTVAVAAINGMAVGVCAEHVVEHALIDSLVPITFLVDDVIELMAN